MKDELRIAGQPNSLDSLRIAGDSSFDSLKIAGSNSFDEFRIAGTNSIFDELKETSGEKRAEDFDDYFKEMDITDAEADKRIETAEALYQTFLYFLALLLLMRKHDIQVTEEFLVAQVTIKFYKSLSSVGINVKKEYKYLASYIDTIVPVIVESTLRNETNAWYTTRDRAKLLAEEESNSIHNKIDFQRAVKLGYKRKQWVTMNDERVRQTHRDVNMAIVGINDTFLVGDALMKYPKDENCVEIYPEECIGCRCTVKYIK